MVTKAQLQELKEARENSLKVLHRILKEDDEIGTIVRYGRGQTDYVECFVGDGQKVNRITYYVACAIKSPLTEKGIPRGGAQYDKAHDVVDSLSRVLFGEGGKLTPARLLG